MQDKQSLKKFADFAISDFFQNHFKPYLTGLIAESYDELEVEPKDTFDCIKRYFALKGRKNVVKKILDKIEDANEQLNNLLKKEFNKK